MTTATSSPRESFARGRYAQRSRRIGPDAPAEQRCGCHERDDERDLVVLCLSLIFGAASGSAIGVILTVYRYCR